MQITGINGGSSHRPDPIEERSAALFAEHHQGILKRTDRFFATLMGLQWIAGILFALWVSPKTWAGSSSQTHIHVYAALFLGGLITGFPAVLALIWPGRVLTRHAVAVGQMLVSALFIHLTGGRIETHFHVFGSLAFLAFYRDWRVLVSATVVVAADHFVRGVYWPQSVYGVLAADPWRWLEHAGWVLFEDSFLVISIRQGVAEMLGIAERQAKLEAVNKNIECKIAERTQALTKEIAERERVDAELREAQEELENRVRQRTLELQDSNQELRAEIAARKQAQQQLEAAQRGLLESARLAGMAEVATSVLHNVGNVLNSVTISTSILSERLHDSKIVRLSDAAALMQENGQDLVAFLTNDPKGKLMPRYLIKLSEHLLAEHVALLHEFESLARNVEHIKEIVAMQQSYAKVCGVREVLPAAALVEDALRMNAGALERHEVEIIREYTEVPPLPLDKHKCLQVLVNLISNAKYALDGSLRPDKRLTLRVGKNGPDRVQIAVIDNGIGIAPENMTRIFAHGFTTRKDGHGFGLHSAALAAQEMGGTLGVQSDGLGRGAAFTLELPRQPAEVDS
jgi:C4-dicarboxylate-specific signal transduction histidine kinase